MDGLAVDVQGLRKEYGKVVPIEHLDLRVRAGEVYALLGPNGAGKTTTVEVLTGVRHRTRGDVRVLGEDPQDDRRSWRARIGVVPQHTGEYHDVTVRQVLTHFASFYPSPLPVDDLLERVGLRAHGRRACTVLSGGQRRRLDVAIGLVGRPEIVFLDEPTTGLDPQARREAWQLVRDLSAQGVTTMLTTHYLDEAEALAHRIGILNQGRLHYEGTVAELGMRAGGGAEVSFRSPQAAPPATLQRLGQVRVDGETVTLTTTSPTAAMRELLPWAASLGIGEIEDLQIRRQSLESIYLSLLHTGQASTSNPTLEVTQ